MLAGILLAVILIQVFNLLLKKRSSVFIAIIAFMFTAKFIMFKLNFGLAPTTYNFLFLVMLSYFTIILISKRKFRKLSFAWISSLFIITIYIIILDIWRGVEFWPHLLMIRHYYWGFLIYFVLLTSFKKVDIHSFDRHLFMFVFAQVALGIAQYFFTSVSDFSRVAEYNWRGEELKVLDSITWLDNNIVIGTLFNMANYGNLLGILYNYFLFKFLNGTFKVNNNVFFVFSVFLVVSIALTGIRTSIGTLFFGILLNFFFYDKRKFMLIFLFLLILGSSTLGFLSKLGQMTLEAHVGGENPILRLAGIFALFSSDFNADISTLSRSYAMLQVINENVFFGKGMYFTNPYSGIQSVTDAFLLFHIAEFGIVGLILLLAPYLRLLLALKKSSSNTGKLFVILISILLLQTITDNGLWYLVANVVFFVIMAVNTLNEQRIENSSI